MEQQDPGQAADSPLDESGLCLLSLDGGGVRGLSTLLILKGLMDRTNAERRTQGQPPVKPFELFDLIGGTSTGGLIAIMLGRLKMDIDECVAAYTWLSQSIFEKRKHVLPVKVRGDIHGRFDSEILKESIKKIVESKGFSEVDLLDAQGERSCRVFVCATAYENTTTIHLRDYTLLGESNGDGATIIEAALATSAATTFFEPVTIGVRKYVDGALGSNNPVDQVWNEAQSIWCPDDGQLEPMVKCFVSIGTGNPSSAPIKDSAPKFLTETLKRISTETKRTAENFAARHRGLLDKKRYLRYNVEQGLQTVGLEEYQKRSEIETATLTYLASQEQKFSVRDCARNLRLKQSPTPLSFSLVIKTYNNGLIAATYAPAVPTTYFMVPFPSSEEFTGREDYMLRLEKLVGVPDRHNRVALVGLGGIGKTRIALEFALKYKKSNSTSVFWIHASTASRIEKAYLDIAKKVKIEGWDSQDPKVDKLQLVRDWFESAPGKWTLIVDNADDIDLLYGGGARETGRSWSRLASYFPRTSNGSIILTTRNARVGTMFATIRNVLHVKALTAAESERLLTTRLGDVDSDVPSLADLANVLERVPLALVQAAAFISAESSSVAEYLELYNESDASRIKLLSDDFEDDIRDPDTKNPVAATFEISFKHIKERDPQAASVLSVMSMLDVQAIPKSLLPFDEDPVSFTKALGTLQAFSLITRRNGQSSQNEQQNPLFDLHSLVRLAMRNWLNMSNELETSMVKTMITLSKRFPPGTHESRDVWASYLPHALALLSLEQPLIRDRASPIVTPPFRRTPAEGLIAEAVLRGKVSRSLQAKGDYQSAEQMAQKSLALYEMALGGEHLDTLLGVHSLAVISQQQGRYGLAEEMSRRAVDGYKKILGNDHPYTLAAMNNLAIALGKQGNYELAEEVNRQALEGNQKVLGKDHPDTIRSISNLAVVFREQGKYGLAEEMTRQALKGYEKTLGKDHPDTLTSMNNLAVVLHIQGKYEPAEEINRRALEVRERVLGSEHPDTLQSKSDLAVVLWEQGRCEAAEEMNRKVLERSEKVLGKDHPLALTSMINMASIMLHQKLYDSAHTLSQRALSGSMNTLGSNNRITLECSRVHSSILKEAKGQPGYPGEARPTSPAIDEAQPNTIRAAIKAGHHSSQPPDTAI